MKRLGAASLSLALFVTQVLFAHSAEVNLWEQRRTATRSATQSALSFSFKASPRHVLSRGPLSSGKMDPGLRHAGMTNSGAMPLSDLIAAISPAGTVRNVVSSKKAASPTILYIQDIHGHPEAQRNISSIILSVLAKYPNAVVALEGANGDIDMAPFRRSTNRINKEVGSFFLNTGLITGAEYAGFAAQQTPHLFGVEDDALYLKNIEAVRAALPLQQQSIARVEKEKAALWKEKASLYSPQMLDLDAKTAAYHAGTLNVGDYLVTLERLNPGPALNGSSRETLRDDGKYSSIKLFASTWRLEQSIDFDKADRERAQFVKALVNKLSNSDQERLLDASAALRAGSLAYPDYYRRLKQTAEKAGVSLSNTPEFNRYVTYVLQADAIKPEQFLTEVSDYEKRAWLELCRTEEQRKLFLASNRNQLEEKLVRLSLTAPEWREYQGNDVSSPFERFYEAAEARNAALSSNLKKRLASSSSNVAVLVAGGFHADGLNKLLGDGSATLVTITPKLKNINATRDNSYLDVFTRDKTPLEKLFEAPKISLVKPIAIANAPSIKAVATLLPTAIEETNRVGTGSASDGKLDVNATGPGTVAKKETADALLTGSTDGGINVEVSATAIPDVDANHPNDAFGDEDADNETLNPTILANIDGSGPNHQLSSEILTIIADLIPYLGEASPSTGAFEFQQYGEGFEWINVLMRGTEIIYVPTDNGFFVNGGKVAVAHNGFAGDPRRTKAYIYIAVNREGEPLFDKDALAVIVVHELVHIGYKWLNLPQSGSHATATIVHRLFSQAIFNDGGAVERLFDDSRAKLLNARILNSSPWKRLEKTGGMFPSFMRVEGDETGTFTNRQRHVMRGIRSAILFGASVPNKKLSANLIGTVALLHELGRMPFVHFTERGIEKNFPNMPDVTADIPDGLSVKKGFNQGLAQTIQYGRLGINVPANLQSDVNELLLKRLEKINSPEARLFYIADKMLGYTEDFVLTYKLRHNGERVSENFKDRDEFLDYVFGPNALEAIDNLKLEDFDEYVIEATLKLMQRTVDIETLSIKPNALELLNGYRENGFNKVLFRKVAQIVRADETMQPMFKTVVTKLVADQTNGDAASKERNAFNRLLELTEEEMIAMSEFPRINLPPAFTWNNDEGASALLPLAEEETSPIYDWVFRLNRIITMTTLTIIILIMTSLVPHHRSISRAPPARIEIAQPAAPITPAAKKPTPTTVAFPVAPEPRSIYVAPETPVRDQPLDLRKSGFDIVMWTEASAKDGEAFRCVFRAGKEGSPERKISFAHPNQRKIARWTVAPLPFGDPKIPVFALRSYDEKGGLVDDFRLEQSGGDIRFRILFWGGKPQTGLFYLLSTTDAPYLAPGAFRTTPMPTLHWRDEGKPDANALRQLKTALAKKDGQRLEKMAAKAFGLPADAFPIRILDAKEKIRVSVRIAKGKESDTNLELQLNLEETDKDIPVLVATLERLLEQEPHHENLSLWQVEGEKTWALSNGETTWTWSTGGVFVRGFEAKPSDLFKEKKLHPLILRRNPRAGLLPGLGMKGVKAGHVAGILFASLLFYGEPAMADMPQPESGADAVSKSNLETTIENLDRGDAKARNEKLSGLIALHENERPTLTTRELETIYRGFGKALNQPEKFDPEHIRAVLDALRQATRGWREAARVSGEREKAVGFLIVEATGENYAVLSRAQELIGLRGLLKTEKNVEAFDREIRRLAPVISAEIQKKNTHENGREALFYALLQLGYFAQSQQSRADILTIHMKIIAEPSLPLSVRCQAAENLAILAEDYRRNVESTVAPILLEETTRRLFVFLLEPEERAAYNDHELKASKNPTHALYAYLRNLPAAEIHNNASDIAMLSIAADKEKLESFEEIWKILRNAPSRKALAGQLRILSERIAVKQSGVEFLIEDAFEIMEKIGPSKMENEFEALLKKAPLEEDVRRVYLNRLALIAKNDADQFESHEFPSPKRFVDYIPSENAANVSAPETQERNPSEEFITAARVEFRKRFENAPLRDRFALIPELIKQVEDTRIAFFGADFAEATLELLEADAPGKISFLQRLQIHWAISRSFDSSEYHVEKAAALEIFMGEGRPTPSSPYDGRAYYEKHLDDLNKFISERVEAKANTPVAKELRMAGNFLKFGYDRFNDPGKSRYGWFLPVGILRNPKAGDAAVIEAAIVLAPQNRKIGNAINRGTLPRPFESLHDFSSTDVPTTLNNEEFEKLVAYNEAAAAIILAKARHRELDIETRALLVYMARRTFGDLLMPPAPAVGRITVSIPNVIEMTQSNLDIAIDGLLLSNDRNVTIICSDILVGTKLPNIDKATRIEIAERFRRKILGEIAVMRELIPEDQAHYTAQANLARLLYIGTRLGLLGKDDIDALKEELALPFSAYAKLTAARKTAPASANLDPDKNQPIINFHKPGDRRGIDEPPQVMRGIGLLALSGTIGDPFGSVFTTIMIGVVLILAYSISVTGRSNPEPRAPRSYVEKIALEKIKNGARKKTTPIGVTINEVQSGGKTSLYIRAMRYSFYPNSLNIDGLKIIRNSVVVDDAKSVEADADGSMRITFAGTIEKTLKTCLIAANGVIKIIPASDFPGAMEPAGEKGNYSLRQNNWFVWIYSAAAFTHMLPVLLNFAWKNVVLRIWAGAGEIFPRFSFENAREISLDTAIPFALTFLYAALSAETLRRQAARVDKTRDALDQNAIVRKFLSTPDERERFKRAVRNKLERRGMIPYDNPEYAKRQRRFLKFHPDVTVEIDETLAKIDTDKEPVLAQFSGDTLYLSPLVAYLIFWDTNEPMDGDKEALVGESSKLERLKKARDNILETVLLQEILRSKFRLVPAKFGLRTAAVYLTRPILQVGLWFVRRSANFNPSNREQTLNEIAVSAIDSELKQVSDDLQVNELRAARRLFDSLERRRSSMNPAQKSILARLSAGLTKAEDEARTKQQREDRLKAIEGIVMRVETYANGEKLIDALRIISKELLPYAGPDIIPFLPRLMALREKFAHPKNYNRTIAEKEISEVDQFDRLLNLVQFHEQALPIAEPASVEGAPKATAPPVDPIKLLQRIDPYRGSVDTPAIDNLSAAIEKNPQAFIAYLGALRLSAFNLREHITNLTVTDFTSDDRGKDMRALNELLRQVSGVYRIEVEKKLSATQRIHDDAMTSAAELIAELNAHHIDTWDVAAEELAHTLFQKMETLREKNYLPGLPIYEITLKELKVVIRLQNILKNQDAQALRNLEETLGQKLTRAWGDIAGSIVTKLKDNLVGRDAIDLEIAKLYALTKETKKIKNLPFTNGNAPILLYIIDAYKKRFGVEHQGGYWFWPKHAAVRETFIARVLPVATLAATALTGWWLAGGLLVAFVVVPSTYKVSHLIRGWNATFLNYDVDHLTRRTVLAMTPLLLLPFFPVLALTLYGIGLIPLTIIQRESDKRAARVLRDEGPLQEALLRNAYDFYSYRQSLERTFDEQAAEIRSRQDGGEPSHVREAISNAAYLSGRLFDSPAKAVERLKSLAEGRHPLFAARLAFSWALGFAVQLMRNELAAFLSVVTRWQRALGIRSKAIHVLHADALFDSDENLTAHKEVAALLLDTAKAAMARKQPVVFVARKRPGSTAAQTKTDLQMIVTYMTNSGIAGTSSELAMYLVGNSQYIIEPQGDIIDPDDIHDAVARVHGSNIWMQIYSPTPDQFDVRDNFAQFVLFGIAGGAFIPVSVQLEGAKVVLIGA